MRARTNVHARGSNTENHVPGPDVQIISGTPTVIGWRFTISKASPGSHVFSPTVTRAVMKSAAGKMAQGDTSGARGDLGTAVCDWLDGLAQGARDACYEGLAELGR